MKIEPMKSLLAVALLATAATSAVYGGIFMPNPSVDTENTHGFISERDLEGPDPLGVWWEQRGTDVRFHEADEAQDAVFVKLGDIKGDYREDDEAQDAVFVKLGDIKGDYREDDEAQDAVFVKFGGIQGEYREDTRPQGHVDSSDIALLLSYYGKPQGDVNGDGKSDVKDVATMLDWMGQPRIEFLLQTERGPEDSDDGLSWNDDAPAPKAASQLDGGRN